MKPPTVSVVIPCYNQGETIEATVASVQKQSFEGIEIVIVDDGSDDSATISVLQALESESVKVLHTVNQGLAAARNAGISVASGEYVLPLDGDDFIGEYYIEKAVDVFERENVGIVYCKAQLFGAVDTEWLLPSYSLERMLLDNVIFCSAMFRRSDWQEVGGYDPGMIYGWEDYDFWLSLIERGRNVYQIPEILFFYRVTSDSMVRSKARWQKAAMFKRIFQRHNTLFAEHIDVWIDSLLDVHEKYYTSKLYIDTGNGVDEENCLSRKVDIGSAVLEFPLDGFEKITAIRFDPVDVPAVIEINEVRVENKDGQRFVVSNFSDNSIGMEEGKLFFDTNDPNCFFDLRREQLQNIKSITVDLRFIALATDALQQIIQFQQKEINVMSGKRLGPSGGAVKAIGKALQKKVWKMTRWV